MAANYWLGVAPEVAQVESGAIASVDATPANNTFTVTVGGSSESVAGDTNTDTTAGNLRTALQNSTKKEIAQITWGGTASNITATSKIAGLPIVATLSVSGAGSGSITQFSNTTPNSSPYDWTVADNWSLGTVPASGDEVYIDKPSAKILWLPSAAVTIDELHVRGNATIGLKSETLANAADASAEDTGAPEYRTDYLKVSCALVKIGQRVGPGAAQGSPRCKIDNSATAASSTEIFDTAQQATESDLPCVRLLFNDADADLFIRSARGGVGVAVDQPGETATLGTISISDASNVSRVWTGDGVTMTKFEASGGVTQLEAAATIATVDIEGGDLTVEGAQQITTLTVDGGEVTLNNRGASNVAAATLTQNGGIVNLQENTRPVTITTYNFNEGTRRIDDHVTITTDNRSGRVTEQVS